LKHLEPWHKVRSIQNHQHKVRRFSNCNHQSTWTFAFSSPLHNTRKMIKRLDLGIIVVDDAWNASERWIHTQLILIVFLLALSKERIAPDLENPIETTWACTTFVIPQTHLFLLLHCRF
jgi:hypothetical protein